MTLEVAAPISGSVLDLADVTDPVFADLIVGPGVAIVPPDDGVSAVTAPVEGTVVTLYPHAFVLATEQGPGVLVHLGIDTVRLHGEGFTVLVSQRQLVTAGQPLVEWSPSDVRRRGLDPVVPVIVLEADDAPVTTLVEPGARVQAGDALLRVGQPFSGSRPVRPGGRRGA